MKRTIFLIAVLLISACEKDNTPVSPSRSGKGTIEIVFEDSSAAGNALPDSLAISSQALKPARLSQLEVRVLRSDKSVLTSESFTPSNGMFNVSMTVEALDDLIVLCIGSVNNSVEYVGVDDDVDVQPGKTTTAIISGWSEPFKPEIGSISPNPSLDGTYTVSWTQSLNASGYLLQESDNDKFAGVKEVYSGPDLQKTITGKTSDTYYYRVQAQNRYGISSGWSQPMSVVVNTEKPVFTISGTVTGADGVTVALSGDGVDTKTVNNGGTYSFTVQEGGNYTVTPSKDGYTFTPQSASFNAVSSNLTQNFTGTKNVVNYTLTMAVNTTGWGTTSPSVGAHIYDSDTSVTITATPASGYRFVNWTGSVSNSTSDTTTVTMSSDTTTVTANFEKIPITQYTLTMAVNTTGWGTTSPSVGEHTYDSGTSVNITAMPASGYRFVNWTGSVSDTGKSTTTVTMSGNMTVIANFEAIPITQYTLTMAVNTTDWGTTSPTVSAHSYDEGTTVNIIATPSSGYRFVSWTGNVSDASSATTTITMSGDRMVTANFEAIQEPSTEIVMVSIPGGTFQMGDEVGDLWDECRPVHTVTVSSFEMSIYEVMQGQYTSITGTNPSYFKLGDNYPVEQVSWYDAVKFCNKLSDAAGLERCYNESTWECDFSKNGFRLPTEAEWEYACRGGKQYKYGTDDGTISNSNANYDCYIHNPVDVGSYPGNPFGLYDMSGNVWEWCHDWYGTYPSGSVNNPSGAQTGSSRVSRGGSWYYGPDYTCRSAYRGHLPPDFRYDFTPDGGSARVGFRVVRRP